MQEFLEKVKTALEKEHIIVFVDADSENYKKAAVFLFEQLQNLDVELDQMNSTEFVTRAGMFLCVKRLMDKVYVTNNLGYRMMIFPNEV